jgi:hypothetical protein
MRNQAAPDRPSRLATSAAASSEAAAARQLLKQSLEKAGFEREVADRIAERAFPSRESELAHA